MEDLEVRCATDCDVSDVSAILTEAASWLEEKGMPLWNPEMLSVHVLKPQVSRGEFWLCYRGEDLVGVLKFQLEDRLYWPDSIEGEAAYVHKLVVRRACSGEGLSRKMLEWAVKKTAELDRVFLRLDCEASREQLRQIYEDFGFVRVSDVDLDGRIMARFQLDVLR